MDLDSAKKTMIENLPKNTGKSLEEWMKILSGTNFSKHGEIVKYLKEKHSVTHGYANMLAHHHRGSDSDMVENKDDLVVNQYNGCLLYTSPSPRDVEESRMPSSA